MDLMILVRVLVFVKCFGLGSNENTLSTGESLSLRSNRTLVSPNGVFEFGFFNPNPNGNRWYVGIWYKNIPKRTYVWVANRERPLSGTNGILKIYDNHLVLRDESLNDTVWSTDEANEDGPLLLELLDNGNLVMKRLADPLNYWWESFLLPTDTLLPHMELQSNSHNFLTSWKGLRDPTPGTYSFRIKEDHFYALSVWVQSSIYYQSDPWNGNKFPRVPNVFRLTRSSRSQIQLSIASYSRMQVDYDGILKLYTWNQSARIWNTTWTSLLYGPSCPINAYCIKNQRSKCIERFYNSSGESIKKETFKCQGDDKFLNFPNMNVPTTETGALNSYGSLDIKDCRKRCLDVCDCVAYFISYGIVFDQQTCFTITGEISNFIAYPTEGNDIYIRLGNNRKKTRLEVPLGISIPLGLILFISICLYIWRMRTASSSETVVESEVQLINEIIPLGGSITDHMMDYGDIVQATQNFSTLIGKGGFATVYKGVLRDGQEVAVKKLKAVSNQGTTEFVNEVRVVASLQHINLVRLLGWSSHGEEKILVYEYMVNGNLESHLFAQDSQLTWETRFNIIIGVARGLMYLQEESLIKIIHRDMKAANILLDGDMKPKISDFGLARISKKNENEVVVTTKTAGTYGYMSPEYAVGGQYSEKSDIYSFGVTILEIVSGKKNRTFSDSESHDSLTSYAWIKLNQNSWEEIVDEKIMQESLPSGQILRCIEVALLCCQENETDRPKMSLVVAALENESLGIPKPKQPGFFIGGTSRSDIPSSSSNTFDESSMSTTFPQIAQVERR